MNHYYISTEHGAPIMVELLEDLPFGFASCRPLYVPNPPLMMLDKRYLKKEYVQ